MESFLWNGQDLLGLHVLTRFLHVFAHILHVLTPLLHVLTTLFHMLTHVYTHVLAHVLTPLLRVRNSDLDVGRVETVSSENLGQKSNQNKRPRRSLWKHHVQGRQAILAGAVMLFDKVQQQRWDICLLLFPLKLLV